MKSPILLSTIPKAGTYFFAEILTALGASNRHLHLAKDFAENLLLFGDEVNKTTPSKAKVPLKLSQALYTVQAGEFVFGHIAKPLVEEYFLKRFKIVYAYRDHKEAMQAEFHWFREIRKDMQEEFTQHAGLSAEKHFIKYLEIFGPTRVKLFNFMDLWKSDDNVFAIDFNQFRADSNYALEKLQALSEYIDLPVDRLKAQEVLDHCFNKDTKTKVKRDKSINLWTDEANAIYEKLLAKQKLYNFAYPIYWELRRLYNQASPSLVR